MKLPPLSPGNTEGRPLNKVSSLPCLTQVTAEELVRTVFTADVTARLPRWPQPGTGVNVCFPTPQRRWGVRTVWRLSANLGYPGTDYSI